MLTKLKEQPSVGKLVAQYDQLPKRDQQALTVLAIAVLLGVLYFAVWRPVANFTIRPLRIKRTPQSLWPGCNPTSRLSVAWVAVEQGRQLHLPMFLSMAARSWVW